MAVVVVGRVACEDPLFTPVCIPFGATIARYNGSPWRFSKVVQHALNFPPMDDHLELIRRAARTRERQRGEFNAADKEFRRLIREGFEQGITGEQLAEAAGLSLPRVYQIRDGRR